MTQNLDKFYASMELQRKEYDALDKLLNAFSVLTSTAPVDDDYLYFRSVYEFHLHDFFAACRENNRKT